MELKLVEGFVDYSCNPSIGWARAICIALVCITLVVRRRSGVGGSIRRTAAGRKMDGICSCIDLASAEFGSGFLPGQLLASFPRDFKDQSGAASGMVCLTFTGYCSDRVAVRVRHLRQLWFVAENLLPVCCGAAWGHFIAPFQIYK